MLDSLAVDTWPGRVLGAVRLGDPEIVFGVAVLDFAFSGGGLVCSFDGPSCVLTEYGPAVAGRGAISGLLLAGRIGATDMPPWDFAALSGRVRVVEAAACEDDIFDDVLDTFRAGVTVAMAEPGREGRFLVDKAFFCANMVSLNEGFELVVVLFERPSGARAAGSAFFGEFGLLGSFCKSFCAVASRPSIILW